MPQLEPRLISSNCNKVDLGKQDTCCNLLTCQVCTWQLGHYVQQLLLGLQLLRSAQHYIWCAYRRGQCFNSSLFSLLICQNQSQIFITTKPQISQHYCGFHHLLAPVKNATKKKMLPLLSSLFQINLGSVRYTEAARYHLPG